MIPGLFPSYTQKIHVVFNMYFALLVHFSFFVSYFRMAGQIGRQKDFTIPRNTIVYNIGGPLQ